MMAACFTLGALGLLNGAGMVLLSPFFPRMGSAVALVGTLAAGAGINLLLLGALLHLLAVPA